MSHVARSRTRVKGFDNPEMDFQLLRQMGSAAYGGASVGECLAVASEAPDGAYSALARAFAEQAAALAKDAANRSEKKHPVSARDQYLVACNSFRAAEYFTSPDDPDHSMLGIKSRQCFLEAMSHMGQACEIFFIEHGEYKLPAYFMAPSADKAPRPTLVTVSGYDGTTEESWLQIGRAALERNFNLCLFAGPGQMDTLRFNPGSTFEPDYERPVTALLNSLLQRPEIDQQRVALYGISFGGYFASRAAAFEPRVKALIANSPIIDLYSYMTGLVGFDPLQDLTDDMDFGVADIPSIPDEEFPPHLKEMSKALIIRFGRPTYKAVFRFLQEFNLKDALRNIACPALALAGAGEGQGALQQLETFCENVSGPVTRRIFSIAEGADSHCQLGNPRLSAVEVLDWLEEIFD
jgi:pimeloyl-ACP methyl ester carboxylesterase